MDSFLHVYGPNCSHNRWLVVSGRWQAEVGKDVHRTQATLGWWWDITERAPTWWGAFLSTSNPHTCSWRGVLNPACWPSAWERDRASGITAICSFSVGILSGPGSPHCLHPSHLSFLRPNPIQTQPQKQQQVLGRVLLGWHSEDQIGLWFWMDLLPYRGTFPKVCSKDLYMKKRILWSRKFEIWCS